MNNTANPSNGAISQAVMAKVKIPRRFEILVEEFDEEGGPGHSPAWKPVRNDPTLGGNGGNPVITIYCKEDLQEKMRFYKDLGQRFRILREIDPPSEEAIRKAAIEQGLISEPDKSCDEPNDNEKPDMPTRSSDAVKTQPTARPPIEAPAVKQKAKIVTIGGIQIKYDGDKVYQRQWVRLTDDEASNFRIVSDCNNKIVSLSGKHMEAKKWVLIEDTQECEEECADE